MNTQDRYPYAVLKTVEKKYLKEKMAPSILYPETTKVSVAFIMNYGTLLF